MSVTNCNSITLKEQKRGHHGTKGTFKDFNILVRKK